METQSSSKSCPNILIAVVLLTCFSAVFYVYYTPTLNWLQCPTIQVLKQDVCADTCINALQMSNHTQIVNNTCTVNISLVKKQLRLMDESETVLLIWNWPFGQKFDFGPCSSLFNIKGCQLTDDRNMFNKAHGVLFHHRDIYADLSNMPPLPRPSFQKWVWMNMESPSNSAQHPRLNDLFNLTTTYRQDSDITVPYGRISEITGGDRHYKIPHKDKFVCWIVSNWNSAYERSKYYMELKEHLAVQTYGAHFLNRISDEDYSRVVSGCKFYLSFENSIHEDYITEKLFNPLTLGTVPVVLGPPRKNYEKFIPGSAFLHVEDYKSAEDLAAYLKLLDQNNDMYMKYFTWREHFVASGTSFGLEHACRACDHIRRYKNYRVVNDLTSWYWGF